VALPTIDRKWFGDGRKCKRIAGPVESLGVKE
jgi:hypothetical protein